MKEKNKEIIRSYLLSKNLSSAEKEFTDITKKIMKKEKLSELEEAFIEVYMSEYYINTIGGKLDSNPNFDEKLKDVYKTFAEYLLVNRENRTVEKIKFLHHFYICDMCQKYNIKPVIVKYKDDEYFEKNPEAEGYQDRIDGIPVICFNPSYLEKATHYDSYFYQFIVNGLHEIRHEYQEIQVDNLKINEAQSIIWAKEFLTKEVVGENYYKKNYSNVFHERDARNYSETRLKEIIDSIEPGFKYNIRDARENKYNLEVKHYDNDNELKIAIDYVDIVSTDAIGKNPKLLDKYQVLKNVYNEDGTKKNYSQIEHEQVMRMQEEIKVHPEDRDEIEKKYAKIIREISKTDNELFIQKTCLDAHDKLKTNDITGFNSKLNYIKHLIGLRELSYREMINEIDNRLIQLKRRSNMLSHNTDDMKKYRLQIEEQHKIKEEIRSIELLKKCMIEYIELFKDKYDSIKKDREIKSNIEKILGYKMEKHKFVVSPTEVYMVDKTAEELEFDKQRALDNLMNENGNQIYVDYVDKFYSNDEESSEKKVK